MSKCDMGACVTEVNFNMRKPLPLLWLLNFFPQKMAKDLMSKSLFSSDSFIQFYRVLFLRPQNYKVNIEKSKHMETRVLTTLRQTKSKWHKEEQSLLSFHGKRRQKAL